MRELFGTKSCRYTAEMRADLEWDGIPFEEYDVAEDASALNRMLELTGGQQLVSVLVEDGAVVQVGIGGRGCCVNPTRQ
jgi:glutaredoxin 3